MGSIFVYRILDAVQFPVCCGRGHVPAVKGLIACMGGNVPQSYSKFCPKVRYFLQHMAGS